MARIAVAPDGSPDWVYRAVVEGGAEVVPVERAHGLVWTSHRRAGELAAMVAGAPHLRWVQLPWAGVEEFAGTGLFGLEGDGARTWTCGKGVYAEPVAEHALAMVLAGLRGLPARARASRWGPPWGRTLYGGRVTILGAGGIAASLTALLAPFRVEVTVVRRGDEPMAGATRTVAVEHLHDSLPGADAVVLALALTPATDGIIAAGELRLMERHAWLVNVARGRHVVTDDLVTALAEGWIGGAGLDVTEPEPLPDGHPLWGRPDVLITPHTSNTSEMAVPLLGARIRENVRRFVAAEPLVGLVDPALGY